MLRLTPLLRVCLIHPFTQAQAQLGLLLTGLTCLAMAGWFGLKVVPGRLVLALIYFKILFVDLVIQLPYHQTHQTLNIPVLALFNPLLALALPRGVLGYPMPLAPTTLHGHSKRRPNFLILLLIQEIQQQGEQLHII